MMLPILSARETILAAVAACPRVVLTSPTGSGKSTQVPQMLVDGGRPAGKVLVLQPRRIAARMLATRVAWERDQQPGGEVGYVTRFESAVSPASRIVFITEGVLLRMLLDDPELRDVSAIVFDEFHERALVADLGLGQALHLQSNGRPDLLLLVMSATLEAAALVQYLDPAKLVTVQGRQFPVETSYLAPKTPQEPVWETAARGLRQVVAAQREGDILVFMPGAHEIRRTIEAARAIPSPDRLVFLPLYGNLPPQQQDAVMAPVDGRKVIVATNIAETSLTIDGVRHVVDSGLARLGRYDAGRGFDTLLIEPISKFSADQRAGRAGRQAPGTCLRLWSRHQQDTKPLATDPEIRRVDLAEAVLQLKVCGFADLAEFPWLEPPPEGALAAALRTLTALGALRPGRGELTPLGRELARFPAHPRLARLLREAAARRCLPDAAMVAALLTEAPIYVTAKGGFKNLLDHAGGSERGELLSDFFPLLRALDEAHHAHFDRARCQAIGVLAGPAQQVWRTRDYYLATARRQRLSTHTGGGPDELLKALLVAFPEHLARRRDQGTLVCELSDGRRGELTRESTTRHCPLLLAGEIREVGGGGQAPRVVLSLVSEIRREWLEELFPDAWETVDEPVWDELRKVVELRRRVSCLGLTLEESRRGDVPPERAAELLAELVIKGKLTLREWNDEVEHWMQRVRWLAEVFPERGLIRYEPDDIACVIHELCAGERTFAAIRTKPCLPFVQNALSWADQEFVRQMAPDRLLLPCGRRMRIEYRPGHPPKGSARIQELFGLETSPTVAGGRVPLLMEILAPNQRPVQITDDLAGFWRNLYPTVKKELSRRYPRHKWP